MLRTPRRRGAGLPATTIVLALLSVSTVAAPSSPAASRPVPRPVQDRLAAPADPVELVGDHDGPPPASTTVVRATQVPSSPLEATLGEGAPAPHAAIAALGRPSVPGALLAAYRAAAAGAPTGCHLPVSLLAAIGQVESGSLAGRSVDGHHRAVPGVYGPVLSGGGYAAIHDSDGGSLDGARRWDRAVGPMQFIPGTWRAFGRDGDGDGARDPQNVFDAAASAAAYLCLGGRDLRDVADLQSAVLSYNHSTAYVDLVLRWRLRLAGGVAERSDTGPASPRVSQPALQMVVAAAAVPPPLVLVVRTPARSTPAPALAPFLDPFLDPFFAPAPHPTPARTPSEPQPAIAPAVAPEPVVPAVDPPGVNGPVADPPVMPTAVTYAVVTPPTASTPTVVVTPTESTHAATPTVVAP
ncbi:MAG: lytic murein transglycosylase, partial [Cellulomonas sp.]|nr:lytic murein transglycosylase [Cellulomonas sp.]